MILPTRTEWKPAQIIELLEVCLETHFQSYKGDIYTQTDGTPIGSSLSGPLAGIFFAWFQYFFVIEGEFKAQIDFRSKMKDDVLFCLETQ